MFWFLTFDLKGLARFPVVVCRFFSRSQVKSFGRSKKEEVAKKILRKKQEQSEKKKSEKKKEKTQKKIEEMSGYIPRQPHRANDDIEFPPNRNFDYAF